MRIFSLIILSTFSLSVYGQTNEQNEVKEFFHKYYTKQQFKKFDSVIGIEGNFFKYGDAVLEVVCDNKELTKVFSRGLFYPSLISGNSNFIREIKQNKDPIPKVQNGFPSSSIDTFSIFVVKELKYFNLGPTQRRFVFWLYRKHLANPTECFFELTNKSATSKTDLNSFIEGSTLTYFREAWLII